MNKIIIANWKLNPLTEKEAIRLARAEDLPNVVIAPPFIYLSAVGKTLKKAKLGAQDLPVPHLFPKGAGFVSQGPFTGSISAAMLKKLGVKYAIIGHSERRKWFGETDEVVNFKVKAALRAGIKAILCVGEPSKRGLTRNEKSAKIYVKNQLIRGLSGVKNQVSNARDKLFIAYEPVWAIGTGEDDSPSDAAEMAKFIKSTLNSLFIRNSRVLYGGSVDFKNARDYLELDAIDGLLVGGTSLNSREFKQISNYSNHYN